MKINRKKIIMLALSYLLLLIMVTQNFASDVKNKKILGNHLFLLEGKYKIYSPHKFYIWSKKFKSKNKNHPINKNKDYLNFGFLIVGSFILLNKKRLLDSHGTAKWADNTEIIERNLYNETNGVVLGRTKDNKLLTHNGPEHLMMMAPTRMGKGINTVLPTLFTWLDSIVVNDIKGECWDLTAGYRKNVLKQKVLMFAPLDNTGVSCKYNPLDYISLKTEKERSEVKEIATTLLDLSGKGEDDHWITSAINLLIAIILHVKYQKNDASMVDVVKFMTNPEKPLIDAINEVIGIKINDDGEEELTEPYDHTGGDKTLFKRIYDEKDSPKLHPLVGGGFSTIATTPDKERGSIISTCLNKIQIFRDPLIARNSITSNFFIEDLMKEKVSLYLVSPPSSIEQTRPLLRLIYSQIMSRLTMMYMTSGNQTKTAIQIKIEKIISFFVKAPPKKKKNRILLLIDEFPSLGKLEVFEKAIAYCAGYGLKCLFITQSQNQLNKIYTKDNSILDNCHVQIYLTPNDSETPKKVSEMLGQKTIELSSKSGKVGTIFGKSESKSFSGRALMTPGEVRVLPFEQVIIFVAGMSPILGKKIFYFKEKDFMYKEFYQVPAKSDVLRNEEIEKIEEVKTISEEEIKEKQNQLKKLLSKINVEYNKEDDRYYSKTFIEFPNFVRLSNHFSLEELNFYFEKNKLEKEITDLESFKTEMKNYLEKSINKNLNSEYRERKIQKENEVKLNQLLKQLNVFYDEKEDEFFAEEFISLKELKELNKIYTINELSLYFIENKLKEKIILEELKKSLAQKTIEIKNKLEKEKLEQETKEKERKVELIKLLKRINVFHDKKEGIHYAETFIELEDFIQATKEFEINELLIYFKENKLNEKVAHTTLEDVVLSYQYLQVYTKQSSVS